MSAAGWKMARLAAAGAAAVITAGAGLAFAASSPHRAAAQTFGDPYAVPLHQQVDLPVTAEGFHSHGSCPGIPPTKDGWHFVLPAAGHMAHRFVELTVEFDKGNEQVDATFTENHMQAYVSSVAGARLLSASAIVETQHGETQLEWFNLSHTCPASEQPPTTPPCPPESPGAEPGTPAPNGEQPVAPSPSPGNGGPVTLYPPAPPESATESPAPAPAPGAPAPSPVKTCSLPVTG